MSLSKEIVLGIDGGGTYTRVVVADLRGNLLGFSKKAGSHPGKNINPEGNVKAAISEALHKANQSAENVKYLVGGFAGLNAPEDKKWVERYISASGIQAPSILINDAEVAQYGAFLGGPGILAIAGTGSIVLGKTESGRIVRNYDFHHDSEAAARFLSYSSIYEIVTENTSPEDEAFVQSVLNYWDVKDITQLRSIASKGYCENHIEAIQKLSQMGNVVTTGAEGGSKIAYRACEKVVESLTTGIKLVASMFSSKEVSVAFTGGVANHPFITELLQKQLELKKSPKKLIYKASQLPPVLGAVLLAYDKVGVSSTNEVVEKLMKEHDKVDYFL